MNLIKWGPFIEPFDEEFERMVKNISGFGMRGFVPLVDVYQTNDALMVETPLAGIDPKDVRISIENDVLTIEGKMEKKSEMDDKNYYMKEVRSGSFHRSVALPVGVEGNQAKAVFENGMLKIAIPKSERAKPKTIAIEVKDQS